MNVGIVRTLAELFPAAGIGKWVSIDAQMVPAWTVRKSGKIRGQHDAEREAHFRRRCPVRVTAPMATTAMDR